MHKLSTPVMVLTVALAGSLVGVISLRADNPYINIPEMQRLSHEAWDLWWNSLTLHQQQIVHAVAWQEESYQRVTGNHYIPVTRDNLIGLMKTIRAQPEDGGLVLQRMQVHQAAWDAIDKADRMLDFMHRNPNWYMPPNMQ
ncbi:MAG TPA: hypothetical protein VGS07_30220 [Thermoanaerobaculia bacterium]|jgi:hypothetical protein|nr:hypothetical protein [Thermoanaerobaculia bacterium]